MLQQYKWYWRVECVRMFPVIDSPVDGATRRPDVHFHCVVDEDPFVIMEEQKKVYGASPTALGRCTPTIDSHPLQDLPLRCLSGRRPLRRFGRP